MTEFFHQVGEYLRKLSNIEPVYVNTMSEEVNLWYVVRENNHFLVNKTPISGRDI